MRLALTITLAFVALTSLLGVVKNLSLPALPSRLAGTAVGAAMTAWCAWLAVWVWQRL
jgi:hypothetical protein